MTKNSIEQLRAGALAGSRRLRLSCGLVDFPREIFTLADTLEILDLSGNALSSLPDDLPRLHRLRILFCSDNQFTTLPEVLGQCPQLGMVGFKANRIHSVSGTALPPALRWLILTDNQLDALPAGIGRCTQLQKLMLAGNRLRALPQEITACTRLELLRIAANRFVEFPECVLALPRLSWLAFAGNPFCQAVESAEFAPAPITAIDWDQLEVQHQLGEGASGVIHQALWRNDGQQQDVALKLFKGALTSDGLPQSEMNACISAGAHPNLIPVLGKIERHPAGAEGLVMSLVDSGFRNLAAPPSLDSCTRDIYPASTRFTLSAALGIAVDIAAAAQHLHGQGIAHGDLYAHNILCNEQGGTLLGDFGAASRFMPEDQHRAHALQRIEVRAFSCLLEELLERCSASTGSNETLSLLGSLQVACAQANTAARPLFAEIHRTLLALAQREGSGLLSSTGLLGGR